MCLRCCSANSSCAQFLALHIRLCFCGVSSTSALQERGACKCKGRTLAARMHLWQTSGEKKRADKPNRQARDTRASHRPLPLTPSMDTPRRQACACMDSNPQHGLPMAGQVSNVSPLVTHRRAVHALRDAAGSVFFSSGVARPVACSSLRQIGIEAAFRAHHRQQQSGWTSSVACRRVRLSYGTTTQLPCSTALHASASSMPSLITGRSNGLHPERDT